MIALMVRTVDITAPFLRALREPRQKIDTYGRTKGEIETSVGALANSLGGPKRSGRTLRWVKGALAFAVIPPFFVALGSDNWAYRVLAFVIGATAVLSLCLIPPSLPGGLTSTRAPLKGRLAYYCGGGLVGLGLTLFFAIPVFGKGDLSLTAWFVGLGTAIVMLVVGMKIGQRGRRLLQPTASELQTHDTRRPIVLLRSFCDDDLSVVTGQDDEGGLNTGDFEESIEDQFAPFGPFVAIGKPGEALPELGAARNYHSDAEWQEAVVKWMEAALVLVVIPGLTGGLGWELETIRRGGYADKLLVLMPPRVKRATKKKWGQVGMSWEYSRAEGWSRSESLEVEERESLSKRWDTLRVAFMGLEAFEALPADEPAGIIGMHLGCDGGLVLLTGPEIAWEADYERAIRFALYGMFCHEKGGSEMTKVLQFASN